MLCRDRLLQQCQRDRQDGKTARRSINRHVLPSDVDINVDGEAASGFVMFAWFGPGSSDDAPRPTTFRLLCKSPGRPEMKNVSQLD